MIVYQTISYFRNRIERLLSVKRGVYATVEDEICREFKGKNIEQVRQNYDMVLIDTPRIIIKLRLPDKKHRLAKKDGFRLIYLVYKDRDEVVFLDVYPKNGPLQQLDEEDDVIIRLINEYAEEKAAGLLQEYDLKS